MAITIIVVTWCAMGAIAIAAAMISGKKTPPIEMTREWKRAKEALKVS